MVHGRWVEILSSYGCHPRLGTMVLGRMIANRIPRRKSSGDRRQIPRRQVPSRGPVKRRNRTGVDGSSRAGIEAATAAGHVSGRARLEGGVRDTEARSLGSGAALGEGTARPLSRVREHELTPKKSSASMPGSLLGRWARL